MVNLLIKKARIINQDSKWHNKITDILIKNGKIENIAKNIKSDYKVFEQKDLHVSLGWYDLNANFCDPGFEYKEDVISGLNAAAQGGFTRVCVRPNTKPVISDKSLVKYLLTKSESHLCDLSVMGSMTKESRGEELAEMYDMSQSGAVLFGDGNFQLSNAGIMNKALQYVKSFNGTLVVTPQDKNIVGHGQVNEGLQSTMMGVRGIPTMAETIALQRDIELLKYSEGKLHVSGLTSAEGVSIVKKAKKSGLNITAGVNIAHLVKTDRALKDYDVNYKLSPPLRSESDRKALVKGLIDGTIDVITSDHTPEDVEHKQIEFNRASYGMISLETFFGLYGKFLSDELPLDVFIRKISVTPYQITAENIPELEVGSVANLTLFSPKEEWYCRKEKVVSKSKNTPFLDEILVGKVWGVINNKESSLK